MTRNHTFLKNTIVWLRTKGYAPKLTHYCCAYDLVVNGLRVEVKEARPLKRHKRHTYWQANIHRHGRVKESEVDVYIIRLVGIPEFTAALYLLIPAPLKTPTLKITLRSLLQRYGVYVDNMQLLGEPTEPVYQRKEGR